MEILTRSRTYVDARIRDGRLNGVGLVLTPLLGPGLIQAVQCRTAMNWL